MRVIAFVDHEIGFRLLNKLISLVETGEIELVAVVTTIENGQQWWPGVEKICRNFGVPLIRYQEPPNEILEIDDIEWYLLLSWKHIIKSNLINKPKKGVINLHYSLLPKYRGVYPVNWAIIEGEKITGITYHFVNERVDDGDIILQGSVPLLMSDTARSLQLRLDDLAFQLFDYLITYLATYEINSSRAVQLSKETASYKSRSDFNSICEIDLEQNYKGEQIINLLRGLSYFPETKNAFFVNPQTQKKIYLGLNIIEDNSG